MKYLIWQLELSVCSCSFFTLLINENKKKNDFHTSKNNYLCVKQPNSVSSVRLETKPLSVHEFTSRAKKLMLLKSQHRPVVQFHEQYSTNKT